MSKHVVVLMGGWSAEREVSLVSGRACAAALERAGYRVTSIDVDRDIARTLSDLDCRPDVVFNALHGRWGEDGCIQGLLEILGLPYTHSGPMASALAMNKEVAKHVFVGAGIPCAEGVVVTRDQLGKTAPLPRPFVVKPNREGSSVGVRLVLRQDNDDRLLEEDFSHGDEVMVESYVPGRELSVAVMGDKALAVTEIVTDEGFYDYRAKYAPGGSRHVVPAAIHADAYRAAMDHALTAHRALDCRGVTRADFRYDDTAGEPGRLCLLEINTQPGMTPTSLVPEQAAHGGMPFGELVSWMVEHARCDA
jgi:D-alanine-D-alanine ligase